MIYLDSSVVLARLFAEPRTAPDSLWAHSLVSSRLLEYEVWNCICARGLIRAHDSVRDLFTHIGLLEMDATRLARALDPFPIPVRTPDSLHLATVEYLRRQRSDVSLASFDRRMIAAARALGIPLYEA